MNGYYFPQASGGQPGYYDGYGPPIFNADGDRIGFAMWNRGVIPNQKRRPAGYGQVVDVKVNGYTGADISGKSLVGRRPEG